MFAHVSSPYAKEHDFAHIKTQSNTHKQWHISINGNSYETRHGKWEFSLSLSLSLQCPVFLPLSSLHLFHIMFSAISLSLSFLRLSFFFSNWGKWVLASRKRRRRRPWMWAARWIPLLRKGSRCAQTPHIDGWRKHSQWYGKGVCVCVSLCVSMYTMAIRRDLLHSTSVSRTLGLLSLINFL